MKAPAHITVASLLLLFITGSALSAAVFSEDDLEIFKSLEVNEVSTSCGGVLTEESGEISYKHNVTMAYGERCVWIIRPGGKITEYTLGVTQMGFQNDNKDTRLSIHGFLHDRITPTAWIPTAVGMEEMKESPVIIVTLHTSSSAFVEGFHFRYFGHAGSETIYFPSPQSTDVVIANNTFGLLRHPIYNGNNYTNLEMSTFVFHQSTASHNTKEETTVALIVEGLEYSLNCLVDVLYVYTYSEESGWEYNTTLCDTTDNEVVKNNDMILMVFDTSPNVTDKGFRLAHASHPLSC